MRLFVLLFFVLATAAYPQASRFFVVDALEQKLVQKYGVLAQERWRGWVHLLNSGQNMRERDRLEATNKFFNQTVRYREDSDAWGQDDYWATPFEMLGVGAGDCEDYALAKYFSLRASGVDTLRLRMAYVSASINGASGRTTQAHMVLLYYESPWADPLVLDNLVDEIRPASRRTDLIPVFTFNAEGLWKGNAARLPSSWGGLQRWTDLLRRMKAEGFLLKELTNVN